MCADDCDLRTFCQIIHQDPIRHKKKTGACACDSPALYYQSVWMACRALWSLRLSPFSIFVIFLMFYVHVLHSTKRFQHFVTITSQLLAIVLGAWKKLFKISTFSLLCAVVVVGFFLVISYLFVCGLLSCVQVAGRQAMQLLFRQQIVNCYDYLEMIKHSKSAQLSKTGY